MKKQPVWRCVGSTAMALMLSQPLLMAEEPPQEVQVEIEVTETVQQAAEQAAEAAKAIAEEAAAKTQEKAAVLAEEAAAHARQAAGEVVEEVPKAAGEAVKQANEKLNLTAVPYHLGLQVAPVSKSLDVQLKLEGKGISIDGVEKDGPGDQAGLKPHDIVVRVAEHDVKSPADLSKTLKDSEGKELKLDVIRGGEKVTIVVQPRIREMRWGKYTSPKIDFDEEIIELESKIREKLKGAGVDVRMQVIRPGQVMPTNMLLRHAELPEGVSISVRKDSGKPAKVDVTRGEEKWDLTEKELDKLPEDLRPHVEHMLGRGPVGIGFPPNVKFTATLPPGYVVAKKAPVAERHLAAKSKVERAATEYQLEVITHRLDDIKKDIHRIYEQIDELREDRKKD